MKLNREGVQLNAEERNKRNQNWATLEDEVSQFESATTDFNKTTNLLNGEITGLKAETAVQKNGLIATNKRVDNVVIEAGTAAYEKVVDASKLIWKEPVVAFSNLATAYPQPQNGWAAQTTSDGAVYRYDGSTWKKIQQVDAGPVNALDTRLTAQLAETDNYDWQTDYVEIVKNFTAYKTGRFRKPSANNFQTCLDNGQNHVTISFIKDPNDDFIKTNSIFTGDLSLGFVQKADATERTGVWTTDYAPNYYTMQEGSTFTCYVKGDVIEFYAYTESRGGLWRFVIDDDTLNPVNVSLYSVTTANEVKFTLKTGLEVSKLHKVVGTFMGGDPANPPSSTPARGYVNYTPASTMSGSIVGKDSKRNNNSSAVLATVNSNKEFAFNITHGAFTGFVPDHGVGVAYKKSEPKVLLDGVEVNTTNLAVFDWLPFTDFKLVQDLNIIVSGTKIGTLTTTHHVDRTGVLSYSCKLKVIEPFKINIFYPLMLPFNQALLNEVYSSIGNSKITDGDDSTYLFPSETENTHSMCAISQTNKDYIVAGKILNPRKTMRYGEVAGKPTNTIRFWQRIDAPKIYWQTIENMNVQSGFTYTWGGQIACANIKNVYDYVK